MKNNILLKFSLCLLAALFYAVGLIFFITDHEPGDRCEMTYMFEYPQYVRVFHDIDNFYPKYGLYAYGEGRITRKARNMHFDGIPVIFIPGNAGSHHQVRSLASVALRKALNSRIPFHFDYFTIDLNSEYSALYGPILFEQQEYVLSAIHRVLELYKNSPSKPTQVILVGHSVGGIVARRVVTTLLKHNKQLVSIIINLASPLSRGLIYFDRYASSFYSSSHLKQYNGTSISIAGGYSDILVPSYLTVNDGNFSVNLVATNIAKCWVESNHVQILWCKQLVLALNRALFDSVDLRTKQISTDQDYVKKVFQHHLVHNSGSHIELNGEVNETVQIDYKGKWIENIQKQYSVEFDKGLKEPHWYMTGITLQPSYEMLTVLAVNLEVTNWAYVCNAAYPNKGGRVCIDGKHLTQYSEILPTDRFKKRLLTVNMHQFGIENSEFSHVVFRALPTDEHLTFHVDTYGSFERERTVSLPIISLQKRVIVKQTPPRALIYYLFFPELENQLQSYQLYVETVNCQGQEFYATASLVVPWANESVHWHYTRSSDSKPFNLRVQNAKPSGSESAKVRLILQPSCTYKISVRLHLIGAFGQLARYYSTFLVSAVATVLLLTFQSQLQEMDKNKRVPIFFSSLANGMKHTWIPACCFLGAIALKSYISRPEYEISPHVIYQGIALTLLILASYMIITGLVVGYCFSLFTLESTVHRGVLRLLARTVTLTFRFSDYFVTFLHKVPFIVAAALIALCFSACGGIALCVGLVFYFLKLTQMSQEYVEQVAWFVLKTTAKKIRILFKKSDQKKTKSEDVLVSKENKEESLKEKKAESSLSCSKTALEETVRENKAAVNFSKEPKQENVDNSSSAETANEGSTDESENRVTDVIETVEASQPENTQLFENITQTNNGIFFHSSMFFIWMFVTILNTPAVLTWAHNFRHSKNLTPDESLLPGLVFSIGAFFLWQFDLPRLDRKFGPQLRLLICTLLVPVSFLYGSVSVYRINYIFTTLFALVLLQQFVAPKVDGNSDGSTSKADTNEKTKHDDIKMKLD